MHNLDCKMREATVKILKKLGLFDKIPSEYQHRTNSSHRLPTALNHLNHPLKIHVLNKI